MLRSSYFKTWVKCGKSVTRGGSICSICSKVLSSPTHSLRSIPSNVAAYGPEQNESEHQISETKKQNFPLREKTFYIQIKTHKALSNKYALPCPKD